MGEHTKTPWVVELIGRDSPKIYRDGPGGEAVCQFFDKTGENFLRAKANATFIVDALKALEMFAARMETHGEWDDGCFYYNGTSASELQEPIRLAKLACGG